MWASRPAPPQRGFQHSLPAHNITGICRDRGILQGHANPGVRANGGTEVASVVRHLMARAPPHLTESSTRILQLSEAMDFVGNALSAAAYDGNLEAMRLLLGKGVDVHAQGGHFGNAFQAVACDGNIEAMRFLLDQGVDINAQGGYFGNALQAAACNDNVDATRLLVDKGADVNAQGGMYGRALQAALAPADSDNFKKKKRCLMYG